jgi:outer membrane receptor for ferrienterochelin and colicins
MDDNGDGFMDVPRNRQVNLYNRWQYHSGKKLEAQFGIKALTDRRRGGQVHTLPDDQVDRHSVYLAQVDNRRIEADGKIGFIYPEKPSKSIGNIFSWQLHDLDASIGLKEYNATQQTFYYQGIYQNIIGSAAHAYKTGVTLLVDRLDETYRSDTLYGPDTGVLRTTPGVFGEYTYSHFDTWKIVAGLRADRMPGYGVVVTPRLHAKVNFNDQTILRFSGGRSFREPYPIADNISVLSSSKQLVFSEGIRAEEAWNYGANLTWAYHWKGRDGTFNVDLYRTHFVHQLVVDRYSDSLAIRFYNLDGESFSNSFQVSLSYELVHGLDARIAYKIDDVRSTFNGLLERKPLVPRDRFLFHLSAAPEGSHWKADVTVNWTGTQRLANTTTDPEFGKLPDTSPSYTLINVQLTREFRRFELYAGAENLTGFRQEHPIISSSDPFSPSFDASNIWGPVDGRRIYAGLRYKIR